MLFICNIEQARRKLIRSGAAAHAHAALSLRCHRVRVWPATPRLGLASCSSAALLDRHIKFYEVSGVGNAAAWCKSGAKVKVIASHDSALVKNYGHEHVQEN